MHPTARRPVFVRLSALAFLGLALGALPARAQTTVQLDVYDFDFGNSALQTHINPTIHVGDTVRWNWVEGTHSTTSVQGQIETWNSNLQNPSFTFQHTFTHTGTFWYFCELHGFDNFNGTAGGMSGEVFVTAAPEPTSVLLVAGITGALGYRVRRRFVKDGTVTG
jgi:plastocyanin